MFGGRANNLQIADLEYRVVLKKPTPAVGWNGELDNDAEVDVQVIASGTFVNSATFTGNLQHLKVIEIPIDHEVVDDSMLLFYVRPVGTITATRYFYSTNSVILGQ